MAFGVVWLGLAAAHLGMADLGPGGRDVAGDALLASVTGIDSRLVGLCKRQGGVVPMSISVVAFPALIVEMLVQSSIGRISVLPARPVEWKSGCIEVLPVGARSLSNG